jgi:hypothetical protein
MLNFADTTVPLYNLLKQNNGGFDWNKRYQDTFDKLKNLLILAPVLIYPNFEKTFILHTNSSDIGIEAALSQGYEDGKHSIAYASRVLIFVKIRYSVTKRETLTVIFAVVEF